MIYSSDIHPRTFGLEIGAQPVRRLRARSGRRTMPGWFPTSKGTLPALRVETLLELDGLAGFEVDPRCVLMATQPHRLLYHEPQPGGRGTIIRSYTPDLAVLMRDGGVVVVDFKVATYAARAEWKAKEALIRDAYWRDHFVVFRTVTEASIGIEPRRTNIGIMLAHRRAVRDHEADAVVRAAVTRVGLPTTIRAIRDASALPMRHAHEDRAFTALVALAMAGEVRFDLGIPLWDERAPVLPYAPVGRAATAGRAA